MLPAAPAGQSEEERAKDMENALDWLRSNGVNVEGFGDIEEFAPSFHAEGFAPVSRRPGGGGTPKDVDSALNWLRNKDDATLDPTGIFKQLDASLPKKPGQSLKERAAEIANALNWMRNRGLDPTHDEEESYPSFAKLDSEPFTKGSAVDSAKEMEDALAWLRNKDGDVDDSVFDPNGVFKRIDSSMPQKPGQSDTDRAKDIQNALNWMRNQGFDLTEDSEADSTFDKAGSASISRRSAEDQANDLEDALNWLRNKDLIEDDTLFDPTGVFKKLDASLPKKAGQSPDARAKDMENALAWMREKGLVEDGKDMSIPSFDKLDQVSAAPKRSPADRAKDMEDALNWLRNKGDAIDDETDPSGKFKKLDSMLPKKTDQSPEDRARDIENSLNWMRNQGLDVDSPDDSTPGFDKVGRNSMTNITSEQRAKDMDDALSWLRNKGEDAETFDPNGVFRQLDSTLPKKADQAPEASANETVKALNWMRNKGLHPDGTDADAYVPTFEPTGYTGVTRRSPDQRAKDLQDILNWMRKGKGQGKKKEDRYDPTAGFRKLDTLLAKKKGETPEDRARDIEGALDWLRSQGTSPVGDESILSLEKIGTVEMSRRTPGDRALDLEDALNWMRNKGMDDDVNDPTGDFRKLDSMLPRKRDQIPDERAREVEGALDWMRNNGVSPDDDDATEKFSKAGSTVSNVGSQPPVSPGYSLVETRSHSHDPMYFPIIIIE